MQHRETTRPSLGEDVGWARLRVYTWVAVVLCPAIAIGALVDGRGWVAAAFFGLWAAAVIEVAKWFGFERRSLTALQAVGMSAAVLLYVREEWVWWPRAYVWVREGLRGILGSP